ncbi:MAG: peptidase M4, partial [Verrucomicrobiota bacterium]|nr:peptidase M4 [Verrucomicrobiota bacterium]
MAKKQADTSVAFEVSPRVGRQALVRRYQRATGAPFTRPLRIYTLDPSVSDRIGGITTVQVPYEKLEPGPVGSLFKIVSDGAPELLRAKALDLDDANLLLTSGLTPSPANGQFHPQMVYAVCSLTYAAFRRALGRDIAWTTDDPNPGEPLRLTVRPFGVREANAGYSRETGDLSFGYFTVRGERAGFTLRGGVVCTSLSHDVIAHETTHALLDGLRSTFLHPTNIDVPAFHEAFSDLVALFLHFTYPEVVENALRQWTAGSSSIFLLTDLAREFGFARSQPDKARALRSGIDVEGIAAFDSDILPGNENAPKRYDPKLEPHALGSVLVSAVFEAFVTVVKRKIDRFFRIAERDPKTLGEVALSEPLVQAIAQEANKVAGQFLNICIRAIDYCPPADVEFGEYLRALITADSEMERTDKWGFREALMRSFRRREIFPSNVRFMMEDAVRWETPEASLAIPELAFSKLRFDGDPGRPASAQEMIRQANALGRFVTDAKRAHHFRLISSGMPRPKGVLQASPPRVESVRVARRATPDNRVLFDLVAEVTQSCTVSVAGDTFDMDGGCTVVIGPNGEIRFVVAKGFANADRRKRQHAALNGPLQGFWKKSGRRFTQKPNVL